MGRRSRLNGEGTITLRKDGRWEAAAEGLARPRGGAAHRPGDCRAQRSPGHAPGVRPRLPGGETEGADPARSAHRVSRWPRCRRTAVSRQRKSPRRTRSTGALCCSRGVAGAGIEPATFRFSGGRSYQLSYPAAAVLTGFEPAASTLTGWRALQTAPQDQASRDGQSRTTWVMRAPNGIRTRATALKGRRPGPLDDEG